MNPLDTYQFLSKLIKDGPEVLAAFIVGIVSGVSVACWFVTKMYESQLKKSSESKAEMEKLSSKLAHAEDKQKLTEQNLKLAEQNTTQANNAKTNFEANYKKLLGQKATLEAEIKKEKVQKEHLQIEVTNSRSELLRRSTTIKEKNAEIANLGESNKTCKQQLQEAQEYSKKLELKANQHRRRYQKKCKKHREMETHLRKVLADGGKIWERPVSPDAPPFVRLGSERKCPIISLLNLKGGVGKTTISLNLAGTLSREHGKRVLLIDCDHQRSLTSLCVGPGMRDNLHKTKQTLQHYLSDSDRTPANFINRIYSLPNMDKCSLVGNTAILLTPELKTEGSSQIYNETQADVGLLQVEEFIMLDWLANPNCKIDIRFLLREALHSTKIDELFDFIIIDCPPRLSTACINAIAASDFLVIPVILDHICSTIPVPHLFAELQRLREKSLHGFDVLGILANRVPTGGASPIPIKQIGIWQQLNTLLARIWNGHVHQFSTPIRQAACYVNSAMTPILDHDHAIAAWNDASAKSTFNALTAEILERINHEIEHP
ncbi:MAG: hypothetical protein EBV06_03095 [Planctomycetia bacterium]|nr:hypothetical protein [Planctomycetia bacterium]